jgi:hypothetical protein
MFSLLGKIKRRIIHKSAEKGRDFSHPVPLYEKGAPDSGAPFASQPTGFSQGAF